jgi:hypothetical protein
MWQELDRVLVQPGRTFARCAQAVLAHAGVVGRGGGFVFSVGLRGQLQGQIARGCSLASPTKQESLDLGVAEDTWALESAKQRSALCGTGATPAPASVSEAGVSDGAEPVTEGEALEPTASAAEAGTSGDAAPDRDLKATKADDAAVPVWLWNDAIRAELEEDPTLRRHSEGTIDSALEVIRGMLLARKFKIGDTRSFFAFLHAEYPELSKPERPCVSWNPKGYAWDTRGRRSVGRKVYQGWWQDYWVATASDERFPGWDMPSGEPPTPRGGTGTAGRLQCTGGARRHTVISSEMVCLFGSPAISLNTSALSRRRRTK